MPPSSSSSSSSSLFLPVLIAEMGSVTMIM